MFNVARRRRSRLADTCCSSFVLTSPRPAAGSTCCPLGRLNMENGMSRSRIQSSPPPPPPRDNSSVRLFHGSTGGRPSLRSAEARRRRLSLRMRPTAAGAGPRGLASERIMNGLTAEAISRRSLHAGNLLPRSRPAARPD